MKVAFFSESPADQAALAVFTEGLLGAAPELIDRQLEGHGVTGVMSALDGVYRGIHYQSDADALVVVVDCDETELHSAAHDQPGASSPTCRFCKLRDIVTKARSQVQPRQGRPPLKCAIGLAVPAIEAWYLVGRNHQVGEAAWIAGCNSNTRPFTKQKLKLEVYGTARPSLEKETECAIREARRIIADISRIEAAFPVSFGLMAKEIRSWAPQK